MNDPDRQQVDGEPPADPDAGDAPAAGGGVDGSAGAEVAEELAPDDVAEQLDGLRIRQLSALRRAAFRARSHVLIGAGACAFTGVLLLLVAAAHARLRGWGWPPLAYAGVGCAALLLAVHFARRAAELSRELRTPTPLPPTPAGGPDFSTLSDGSQHWKNLEEMR